MKIKVLIIVAFACNISIFGQMTCHIPQISYSNDTTYLYLDVDEMPVFNKQASKTAMTYIIDKISEAYPKYDNLTGRVTVSFVVNQYGYTQDVKILTHSCDECSHILKSIIQSMPCWLPGKKAGKFVNTEIILFIKFMLV